MTDRILKAFKYRVCGIDDGGTIHAATASKARYALLLDLRDLYEDIAFSDISMRRAPELDIKFPPEHRIVAELDKRDREIILHAYGYQGHKPERAGYRDHYCTSPADGRMLRLAWELGLFRGPYGQQDIDQSRWVGVFFYLTDLGRHVARSMIPINGEAA